MACGGSRFWNSLGFGSVWGLAHLPTIQVRGNGPTGLEKSPWSRFSQIHGDIPARCYCRRLWQLIRLLPGGFNDDEAPSFGFDAARPGLWPLTCPKGHGCRSSLWTTSHFNVVECGTKRKHENQQFVYLNSQKRHHTPNQRNQTSATCKHRNITQHHSTTFLYIFVPHIFPPFWDTVKPSSAAVGPSPSHPSPIRLCTNSSGLTLGSTPPGSRGSCDSEIQASSTRCRDLRWTLNTNLSYTYICICTCTYIYEWIDRWIYIYIMRITILNK